MIKTSLLFCIKCNSGAIDYGYKEGGFLGLMCTKCNHPISSLKDIIIGRGQVEESDMAGSLKDALKFLERNLKEFNL